MGMESKREGAAVLGQRTCATQWPWMVRNPLKLRRHYEKPTHAGSRECAARRSATAATLREGCAVRKARKRP